MTISRRSILGIGAGAIAVGVTGAKTAQSALIESADLPASRAMLGIGDAGFIPPVGHMMQTLSHYAAEEIGPYHIHVPGMYPSRAVAKYKTVVWTGLGWADLESPEGRAALDHVRKASA